MSDKDAAPVGEREAASNWYDANDPEKVRPIMKMDWPFIHSLVIEAFQAGAVYQRAQQPSAGVVMPDVDDLANFIRYTDGGHKMGAGALAERIVDWLSAPVAGLNGKEATNCEQR